MQQLHFTELTPRHREAWPWWSSRVAADPGRDRPFILPLSRCSFYSPLPQAPSQSFHEIWVKDREKLGVWWGKAQLEWPSAICQALPSYPMRPVCPHLHAPPLLQRTDSGSHPWIICGPISNFLPLPPTFFITSPASSNQPLQQGTRTQVLTKALNITDARARYRTIGHGGDCGRLSKSGSCYSTLPMLPQEERWVQCDQILHFPGKARNGVFVYSLGLPWWLRW